MRPIVPSLVLCMLAAGCGRKEPKPAEAPLARVVSAAEFGGLRWLEGRWAGTLPDGKGFYEGYRFADDSTIVSYEYPDSATLVPSDSGRITLRGGTVRSGVEPNGYLVTELADGRVHFEPMGTRRNNFTWRRSSADLWVATLRGGAQETVYRMRRLR